MSAKFKPTIFKDDIVRLASYYGIGTEMINEVKEFPSYDDQVFLVNIKSQYCEQNIFPVIIKCTIVHDIHRMDLWIELANHLLKNGIPTPKPVLLLKQYAIHHPYIYTMCQSSESTDKKAINVYCYKYINGTLADSVHHTPLFLQHLGNTIANIHTILYNKFTHPHAQLQNEWCVSLTDKTIHQIGNLPQVLDHDQNKLHIVEHYLHYFESVLQGRMQYMPKCVILGDINDSNIVCADAENTTIIGVFDFGESHETCRMFDLAISCAYFIMDKPTHEGIAAMLNIIKAYHQILPLTDDEIDTIFVAICSRLLVTAVFGTKYAKDNPQNPWLLHHAMPAWNTLHQYLTLHPNTVTNIIRQHIFKSDKTRISRFRGVIMVLLLFLSFFMAYFYPY